MYRYRFSLCPTVVFNGCLYASMSLLPLTGTTPSLLPKYANRFPFSTQLQMPAAQHVDVNV